MFTSSQLQPYKMLFPFFVHQNYQYIRQTDFTHPQFIMKGPSYQNTNQGTDSASVSDNGSQTDWKTTYQPNKETSGGNVWSSYSSSSSNQASAGSSSHSTMEKLFDEEQKKKYWEFKWKWKWFVTETECWMFSNIKSLYISYSMRYKFFI